MMKALQFFSLLFWVCSSVTGFAKDPVMGMHPDQLLAVLPNVPPEWKLESSIGSNEISAYPALLTFAIREYSFVPPPLPDGTIPQTQKCKLVLLDSAFDPDRSLIYDDFSEPKKKERKVKKRYKIAGIPVIELWKSPVVCNLRLAFNERLHLTVFLENMNEKEVQQFLSSLNLEALAQAAKNAPLEKPTPKYFDFRYVNEVDPSKNRTSKIAYMTQEEQAAELQSVERFSKSMSTTMEQHDKASSAAGVPPPK